MELSQLTVVNPREIWPHEERDFTPWLAANLAKLADVLGFGLSLDATEHRVGGYELDILAHVDGNDAVVVIENQLTQTDHGHLGQLLAYAAGLDAAVVVWIATDVRDEHRTTIEWLNAQSAGRVSYYLVRPEVVRIEQSKPAVRFEVEVAPSEFSRQLKEVATEGMAERHTFRLAFWEALLSRFRAKGFAWAANRSAKTTNWLGFSVGRSGVETNVSMASGSRMRVEVYCADDQEKQQFDTLRSHAAEVESLFAGETVSWERLDGKRASRFAVYRGYDKDACAREGVERDALFEWISKQMLGCREAARRFLV